MPEHKHCNSPQSEGLQPHGCHQPQEGIDLLLWGSLAAVTICYAQALLWPNAAATWPAYSTLVSTVYELVNVMWWGVAIGIMMLALLARVPREFVMTALGSGRGISGLLRATAAGVLLDLCSHGILMVGAKLYERGASTGQVMAFLIASPWNSFSLTLILIALIGLPLTLTFIGLSMLIAVVTGLLFEALTDRGVLPVNPHQSDIPSNFRFWQEALSQLSNVKPTPTWILATVTNGIRESRMVMRWILVGIILAGLIRSLMAPEIFSDWFGPTIAGLALTMLAATVIEVCSEGSTPIAADLINRAAAPGNGFAFLMTGVSTDYTEIMVLRETTASWKVALFLPLLTVPQVLFIGYLLNLPVA